MNYRISLWCTFVLAFLIVLLAACASVETPAASEAVPATGETSTPTEEVCGTALGATIPLPPVVASPCTLDRALSTGIPHVDETSVMDYATLRDIACVSLMDINLAQTALDYPEDVFWAFFLNFRAQDASDPLLRYACLRLFGRDHSNGTAHGEFKPIDNGGVLIPCNIIDDVTFVATSIEESSHQIRSAPDPELDGVVAQFNGAGYVQCPLDVGAEAIRLQQKGPDFSQIPDTPDQEEINSELEVMYTTPDHQFNHFTIAAVVETLDDTLPDHPLLYYQPLTNPTGSALTVCGAPAAFSLPTVWSAGPNNGPLSSQTFWAQLDGVDYLPICPDQPVECMFDLDDRVRYLWTDFGPASSGSDFSLKFAWRALSNTASFCEQITPSGPLEQLDYWIGPAMLYIGFRPDTDEHLHGSLLEVWFDPDNSVKPGNSPG